MSKKKCLRYDPAPLSLGNRHTSRYMFFATEPVVRKTTVPQGHRATVLTAAKRRGGGGEHDFLSPSVAAQKRSRIEQASDAFHEVRPPTPVTGSMDWWRGEPSGRSCPCCMSVTLLRIAHNFRSWRRSCQITAEGEMGARRGVGGGVRGAPRSRAAPPLRDIPSGCGFFTGPWTVTRSSLRQLRGTNAFCGRCSLWCWSRGAQ